MRVRRHGRAAWALLLTATLGWSGFARAQEPGAPGDTASRLAPPDETFSLERAVEIGLRNNRQLRVSRLDLATAEKQVGEAYGSLLPSVDASASYQRNLKVPEAFLPAFIFDPEAPPDQLVPVRFGADNQWSAGVTVDQPVFDAKVFIGVSTAGRFREYRREGLRGTAFQVATGVRLAYLNVLLAREQLRVTQNSAQRVRTNLEEARAMYEAGLASEYDVLRLEVQLANIEPNLKRAENGIAEAERALAVQMGLPEVERVGAEGALHRIELDSLDANEPQNRALLRFNGLSAADTLDESALVARAREQRSDLRALRLQRDLEQVRVSVQRSELFPRLSAFFNYTYSAQENGALNFFGQNPNQRTASSAVGLRLEVPVFSGGQRWNRVQQRKIAVRQIEQQLAEATQQAESEVRSTLEQVSEAAARASAQQKAVGQAQRGFEIANAEYLAGTGARIELTEAELALRQAELNYAQAVYDYLTARARLDLAVGVVPEADAALQGMWEKPGDLPPVTATEGRRATDG